MKRSISALESISEAGECNVPKLRRAQSDASGVDINHHRISDVLNGKDGILRAQNRALNTELAKRKREIETLKNELHGSVMKERIKEAEFIATSAVFTKFHNRASSLIKAVNSEDRAESAESKITGITQFLSFGQNPILEDVDLCGVNFNIDEWCNSDAYGDAAIEACTVKVSADLRNALEKRVDFLLKGLEQIVNASAKSIEIEINCSEMLKQMEAENFKLNAEVARLKMALKNLGNRLFVSEKNRRHAERELDLNIHQQTARSTGLSPKTPPAESPTVLMADAVALNGENHIISTANKVDSEFSTAGSTVEKNADVEEKLKFMSDQLTVLTRQLSESEDLRLVAEKSLKEHLQSSNGTASAGSSEDVDAIMNLIKQKFISHISLLESEVSSLHQELAASASALSALENRSIDQIEKLSDATKRELQKISQVLQENEKQLAEVKAENESLRGYKLQTFELNVTVDALRAECATLREQKKKLVMAIERLENNLTQSRSREAQIIGQLRGASNSSDASIESSGAKVDVTKITSREQDLAAELEDAKSQMNDLILEIETVVASEEKSRDQTVRLLQQMSDNQQSQMGFLEQNSMYQSEIRALNVKLSDSESKLSAAHQLQSQQECMINFLKESDQRIRNDFCRARQALIDSQSKEKGLEAALCEVENKYAIELSKYESLKKRFTTLSDRLDVTSDELEAERKKRRKSEMPPKKDSSGDLRLERCNSTGSQAAESSSEHDKKLLAVTLEMLRCSVCKDRFKAVAITRCFHLFCRDCIEENLRNRHRKCPACGEKFGQDDVKSVYFTH